MTPPVHDNEDQDHHDSEEEYTLNWGDGFHDPLTCKACLYGIDYMHGKVKPDGSSRGVNPIDSWKAYVARSKKVIHVRDGSTKKDSTSSRKKKDRLTMSMFDESQGDQN